MKRKRLAIRRASARRQTGSSDDQPGLRGDPQPVESLLAENQPVPGHAPEHAAVHHGGQLKVEPRALARKRAHAADHRRAAMTAVSADFAQRQDRYTGWRSFIRGFLLQTLAFHILVTVKTQGMDHIPPDGPTILMMNHIGGIDPFVMLGAVKPRFVVPMSKVENFKLPLIGQMMKLWGAYPIHRGEVDRVALQNTIDLLKAGNLVLMAPEGTRQPAMIEGKDGITYVAIKSDAAIAPVGLEGTRDFNFGRAFRFRTDGRERIPRTEMAHMTQEAMHQLAQLVSPARRGFYNDLSKTTTETIEFVN
jgi:1-acyl-sn-glycerol-3-phosphate acyltransferase